MEFAVLYRWRLHPGREAEFTAAWADLTRVIRTTSITGGSRLHRTDDGLYVAYAVWPSPWSDASVGPHPAMDIMTACIAERFPSEPLAIAEDLLA